MLPVLDQLLGTFFEHLKNMYLTWIASVDKKVEESRILGVVVSGKLLNLSVFAPLPCTVYLVLNHHWSENEYHDPNTNPKYFSIRLICFTDD